MLMKSSGWSLRAYSLASLLLIFCTSLCSAEGAIQFLDDRPLVLNQEEAFQGKDVSVINVGGSYASIVPKLVGFNFKENKSFLAETQIFDNIPKNLLLPPGASQTITVRLLKELDPGKYQGSLVVYGANTGVLRKNVTILMPAMAQPKGLQSPIDEVTLNVWRPWGPFSGKFVSASYLLLSGDMTAALPRDGRLLGMVHTNNQIAQIFMGKDVSKAEDMTRLPIRIDDLSDVGTYTGFIDIPTTNNADKTAIKLIVADHWIWAVLAVIFGLLASFCVQMLWYRTRLDLELQSRCNKWYDRYSNSCNQWNEWCKENQNESLCKYKPPNNNVIGEYRKKFFSMLEIYRKKIWHFDPKSDDFKILLKVLEAGERDSEVLGCMQSGSNPFKKSYDDLKKSLEDFINFIDKWFPEHLEGVVINQKAESQDRAKALLKIKPLLVKSAANLLVGGQMNVGDADRYSRQMNETREFIEEWKKMAKKIKRLDLWGKALDKVSMEIIDKKKLKQAMAKVGEAKFELWETIDSSNFKDLSLIEDEKSAYGQMAYLGAKYGVWHPLKLEEDPDNVYKLILAMRLESLKKHREKYFGHSQTVLKKANIDVTDHTQLFSMNNIDALRKQWEPKKEVSDQTLFGDAATKYTIDDLLSISKFMPLAEQVPAIQRGIMILSEFAVLAFSLVIAIIAAVGAFYFGKTFGTGWDYVQAFLIGAGLEAALQTLNSKITEMRTPLKS